ncbi:hypothetical protein CANCADRAFT_3818 [Tortispora caseinolytica NRRL Y-17796]|uniref:F-box domain-containing protein n=1 Tax=Tortispora caseinolytica NRRL Y-17796 TaxID=767744 RepID=A0A1E4TBQ5_9ASCO|nr:hypothetical protein CANCADRAFT_3818 [Tortispora caseinolytica NRRL Y-17796]
MSPLNLSARSNALLFSRADKYGLPRPTQHSDNYYKLDNIVKYRGRSMNERPRSGSSRRKLHKRPSRHYDGGYYGYILTGNEFKLSTTPSMTLCETVVPRIQIEVPPAADLSGMRDLSQFDDSSIHLSDSESEVSFSAVDIKTEISITGKQSRASSIRSLPSTCSIRSFVESVDPPLKGKSTTPLISSLIIVKKHIPLDTLPIEVLSLVCSFLDQPDLYKISLLSRRIAIAATPHLYASPVFLSSYRFAQFTSTVSRDSRLASYVRNLDLPTMFSEESEMRLQRGLGKPNGSAKNYFATWRDWKYRTDPLYMPRRSASSFNVKNAMQCREKSRNLPLSSRYHKTEEMLPVLATNGAHPLQSALFSRYSKCKDAPIGAILQLLLVCKNLRSIDLSNVPLASDYKITYKYLSNYTDIPSSGNLFVFEIPKAYTFKDDEITRVREQEIILAMCHLKHLQVVNMRGVVWVSEDMIKLLFHHVASLQYISLTGSGMSRNLPWAVSGNVRDLKALFSESEDE